MEEPQDPYTRARAAFADLDLKDRAVFLAQESIGTIAMGVEEAARVVARDLECFFGTRDEKKSDGEPEEAA